MSEGTWHPLRRRLLFVTVALAFAAAFVATAGTLRLVTFEISGLQLDVHGIFDGEAERCQAAPESWHPGTETWEAWAYDEQLQPTTAGAPELPWRLTLQLAVWGRGGTFELLGERRPFLMQPLAGEGPCAWLLYSWRPHPQRRQSSALVLGAMMLTVVVLAGLAIGRLFGGPLALQLGRLAAAARQVGSPGYVTPEVDETLADLASLMDHAHERVLGDVAAAEAVSTALERHLDEVAHDLRTPLASLQLRLESLARAGVSEPETLEDAVADTVYLSQLVGNLHLQARLQRLDDTARTVDLGEVVERVVTRLAVLGRRRGIEVASNAPSAPVRVRVDPEGVEQLLSNLVHNGISHRHALSSEAEGHVAVTLEVSGDGFVLEVLDDGPGISQARLEELKRNRRAANRPRGGLGLSIVAAVAERAGWTLQLLPLEPTGLRVRLVGPISTD